MSYSGTRMYYKYYFQVYFERNFFQLNYTSENIEKKNAFLDIKMSFKLLC